MTDRSRFSIVPIGSLHTGWALKVDGRDGTSVTIERLGFAGDVPFANQCAQVFGGSLPSGPSIGARLVRLGRVDSPKPIGHAINLEQITDHTGRLSEGRRGKQ